MSWATAALVGTNIAGSLFGSRSSRRAARQQAEAAQRAQDMQLQAQREAIAANREALDLSLGEQRRQFDRADALSQPFYQSGMSALERLGGMAEADPMPTAEQVMAEPGYQFGLNQGRDAIQGTAAAAGGLYSGRALRELTQFGGDYATGRFNDAFNRMRTVQGDRFSRNAQLAGMGQQAAQGMAGAGMNFADNASRLYGNNANALSSLLMGTADRVGNIQMGNANAQAAARMNRASIWGNGLSQLGALGYMNMGGPRRPDPLANFFRNGTSGD